MIEALISIAVLSVSVEAIAELAAQTHRSMIGIQERLDLIETERTIIASLPERDALPSSGLAGEAFGRRWRMRGAPYATDPPDARSAAPGSQGTAMGWSPREVTVEITGERGGTLVTMIRLTRGAPR